MKSVQHWLDQFVSGPEEAAVFATLGLVLVTFLGVLIEVFRIRARRKAAKARIAALAFVARRQLEREMEDEWPRDDAGRIEKARSISKSFDALEGYVLDLLTAASEASRRELATTREAAERFWAFAEPVNEVVAEVGESDQRILPTYMSMDFDSAEDALQACVSKLRQLDEQIRDANRSWLDRFQGEQSKKPAFDRYESLIES